jgi:hypothetical protein
MSTSKGINPGEKEVCFMPEEFKPGCQRPPIKKPVLETVSGSEVNVKEAKQAMVKVGKRNVTSVRKMTSIHNVQRQFSLRA